MTMKKWWKRLTKDTSKSQEVEVKVHIKLAKLKKFCLKPIKWFYQFGEVTHTQDGVYIFQDNGADVLAVAHLDTVSHLAHNRTFRYTPKNYRVHCPHLDDRLGAYTLIEILQKQFGLKFDILLTEGEETGHSTAGHFKTTKQYNWIFEFDRAGDDVVMYQYDNQEMRKLLTDSGFEVGYGSYTDICKLDDLGCKAFNFGVGYYGQHTASHYADLQTLQHMVLLFVDFFKQYSKTHLPHTYTEYTRGRSSYDYYGGWWDDDYWATTANRTKTTKIHPYKHAVCDFCNKPYNYYKGVKTLEGYEICLQCSNKALPERTQRHTPSDTVVIREQCSNCHRLTKREDLNNRCGWKFCSICLDTELKLMTDEDIQDHPKSYWINPVKQIAKKQVDVLYFPCSRCRTVEPASQILKHNDLRLCQTCAQNFLLTNVVTTNSTTTLRYPCQECGEKEAYYISNSYCLCESCLHDLQDEVALTEGPGFLNDETQQYLDQLFEQGVCPECENPGCRGVQECPNCGLLHDVVFIEGYCLQCWQRMNWE